MSAGYLLRKDDYPAGIATPADVQRLAALLNPYLTALNTLTAQGVTLSDNVSAEVQVGVFAHGVAQQFTLKKLTSARGCLVLGCDSALVRAAPVMQSVLDARPGALPRVSVTVWFDDPTVTRAIVALLFTPEGQLCTTAPVVPEAWQAPALLNGWVNFDAANNSTAGFMKDSQGFVHLRGTVKAGVVGIGTSVFVLPAGFRPSKGVNFPVVSNGAFGYVFIDASGSVQVVAGSNIYVDLDGIAPFDGRA